MGISNQKDKSLYGSTKGDGVCGKLVEKCQSINDSVVKESFHKELMKWVLSEDLDRTKEE